MGQETVTHGNGSSQGPSNGCLRVGHILVHVGDLQLVNGDRRARLTRRAVDILLALGAAGPDGLSRDALMRAVWRDVVVDDAAVKQHIYKLRAAFREVDGDEAYIETIPYGGYRLAMAMVPADKPAGAAEGTPARATDEPAPAVAERGAKTGTRPAWRRTWLVAAGLLVAAAVVPAAGVAGSRWVRERETMDRLVREGFVLMRRSNVPGIAAATERFEDALRLRPGYALAEAGLAEAYSRGSNRELAYARDLARQAVAKDPSCADCHGVLGYILMSREWRWREAEDAIRTALGLDPGNPQLQVWLAQCLAARGQLESAVSTAEEAVRLDPTRPGSLAALASTLYFAGRLADAVSAADKALGLQPSFQPAYKWRYRAFLLLGDDHEAMKSRAFDVSSWAGEPEDVAERRAGRFLGWLADGGRPRVLGMFLTGVSQGRAIDTFRYERAVWKMALHDRAGALEELEAALESRPYDLMYVAVEPAFQPLRSDARFQAIVRRVLG